MGCVSARGGTASGGEVVSGVRVLAWVGGRACRAFCRESRPVGTSFSPRLHLSTQAANARQVEHLLETQMQLKDKLTAAGSPATSAEFY